MHFDPTITLTVVLSTVVWIIALAVAWTKFGGRMDLLEMRIQNVEMANTSIADSLKQLVQNEKQIALIQQQITAMETHVALLSSRVDGFSRGEGFIRPRVALEGEYSRGSRRSE